MSTSSPASSRSWSLARQLTLWYTAMSFGLVLAVSAYQYGAITEQLEVEDCRYLSDKVSEIERTLAIPTTNEQVLREALAPRGRLPFYVRVTFRDGRTTIASEGAEQLLPAPFPQSNQPQEFVTPKGRSLLLKHHDQPDKHYSIDIAMDTSEDDEMLAPLRRRIVYAWAVSLVIALLGGLWLARRGLTPVTTISSELQKIRPTQLEARLTVDHLPRELENLGKTINTMLMRLEAAFAQLTRYSGDISHELRSPLNVLRGTIEVCLSQDRDPEEYRRTLAIALDECSLLGELTEELLLLAQAENPRTVLKREPIELTELIQTLCELYKPSIEASEIVLSWEADESCPLIGDKNLIQRVLVNLLVNALHHTPRAGRITLFATRQVSVVELGVRNTGSKIAEQDREQIFDRFYRVDRARTPARGRVGLGLSIVRGIAELHGGMARAYESASQETVVSVSIPVLADDAKKL